MVGRRSYGSLRFLNRTSGTLAIGIAPGNAELQLRILGDIHSATQFSHSLASEWSENHSLARLWETAARSG